MPEFLSKCSAERPRCQFLMLKLCYEGKFFVLPSLALIIYFMSNELGDTIPRNLDLFVIEDTKLHLDTLLGCLKDLGFHGEVIVARSISEGLKLINLIEQSNTTIDMVISDMHLPNGIGLEILNQLKSQKALADCPFLVMSTESQQDTIISAFEAGATNYIVKPIEKEELLEKLSFFWEKASKSKKESFFKKLLFK
jgi:response regulator RpfG family c-di-GMP phosphodiesterase